MRILVAHVHGAWTSAFVRGAHTYLLPVVPGRSTGARSGGAGESGAWPPSVVETPVADLHDVDLDVVILQQPHEVDLVERWTGRRPGRDLPAVYVEHGAPHGGPESPCAHHPVGHRNDLLLVHVTAFNELFWDSGRAPTAVVAPGIADPGPRWSGELARAATVVDDPLRHGRTVGTDLLAPLAATRPLDLFGRRVERLTPVPGLEIHDGLEREALLDELARRRVYVHTARWTSLGVPLVEAMMLGLPVVAVAAAETAVSVPPDAGVVTTSRRALVDNVARLVDDPAAAAAAGAAAREHALRTWGLDRFLTDWDAVLDRVTA